MKTNIFLLVIIAILSVLLLNKCKNKQILRYKEKNVIDTILRTDTVINKQIVTRKKIIQKLDTLYKILETPREVIIHDTLKCDSLYTLCLGQKQLISLDDSLICNYSNQVENYKHLVKIKNSLIDSLSNQKQYKLFFKGVVVGLVLGSGISFIKK